MADIHEQCINCKFCFELWKTFTETHEMVKNVYDDQCVSRAHCCEFFKQFKDGQQSTRDEPHVGWPSASCDSAHVAQVHEIMHSNRLTVWKITGECNISIGSCHDTLTTKIEMHGVVSMFDLWLMTLDRFAICQELLDRTSEDENFLKKIITNNETWAY
jgi:hypothetical protein